MSASDKKGFQHGQGGGVKAGVFACNSCGKRTRETGSSESNVGLCLTCYDEAGLENEHSDGYHDTTPHPDCIDCREDQAPSDEEAAHDEVLRLCGKTPAGGWVMRQAPENPIPGYWKYPCNVFNLSPFAVKPHRELVAGGETWAEVLELIEGEQRPSCDQCQAAMINGVFCHEQGCPNARRQL